ncbi:MAG: hypothetical protein ACLGIA_10125 [Actinomycetes bacterium]
MDSGLIFAIVVALWLAYLIPDWIRRREHLSSSRTKDRFSEAMRVLARRSDAAPGAREPGGPVYVLGPPLGEVPALGASPVSGFTSAASSAGTAPDPAVRVLYRERRGRWARVWSVVFATLLVVALLATPVLAVIAGLGTVTPAVPLASLAVAVGTLAVLRWTTVLRSRAAARRRRVVAAAPAQRRPVEAVVVAPSTVAPTGGHEDDGGRRASSPRAATDGTWTPVPVPPPTYLLKAAAPQRPAPPQAAAPEPAAASVLPDLDVVVERRRVAGE